MWPSAAEAVYILLLTGGLSYVVTKSSIGAVLPRERFELLRCPFCTSFWAGLASSLAVCPSLSLITRFCVAISLVVPAGLVATIPQVSDEVIGYLIRKRIKNETTHT